MTPVALDAAGNVYTWGPTLNLGLTTLRVVATQTTPVEVKGPGGLGELSGVVAVASSAANGYALTDSGSVLAWGTGSVDGLGNGTTSSTLSPPVKVKGPGGTGNLSTVVSISALALSAAAVTSTGAVDTWGLGTDGELGTGSTTPSTVPQPVEGVGGSGNLGDIVALAPCTAAGWLALSNTGHVYAWGLPRADWPGQQHGAGLARTSRGRDALTIRTTTSQSLKTILLALLAPTSSPGHITHFGDRMDEGTTTGWTIATTPVEVKGASGTGVLSDVSAIAGTDKSSFALLSAPTVSGLSPLTGLTTGGGSVTINGSDFAAGVISDVWLGPGHHSGRRFIYTDHCDCTVRFRRHCHSHRYQSVWNQFDLRCRSVHLYSSTDRLQLHSDHRAHHRRHPCHHHRHQPDWGHGRQVRFDNSRQLHGHSATTITAVTRTHTPRTVTLSVTTAAGTATSSSYFTFVVYPTIISREVQVDGPAAGNTTVRIDGTTLTGVSGIVFGGVAVDLATWTATGDAALYGPVPAHARMAPLTSLCTQHTAQQPRPQRSPTSQPPPLHRSLRPPGPPPAAPMSPTPAPTSTGATAVKFGSTTAASFTVTSATTIKAVTRRGQPAQ